MRRAAWISLALLVAGGDAAAQETAPLPPGRYCAYDPVSSVTPPGDIRTRVVVEQRDGEPYVSFLTTWPHSDRLLTGEGQARTGPDGVLTFHFEDGWGNHSEGRLSAEGDFEIEPLGPPPDDWANSVRIYMYGAAHVTAAACRPDDLD